jgi:hypothetical protein
MNPNIYTGNPTNDVTTLAQAIYLQTHGIENDVTGTDLASFLAETVTWTNFWASEFELAADWKFLRTNNNQLGVITVNNSQYTLAPTIRKPIYHPQRMLTIQQDGVVVSKWTLVDPDQIQSDPRFTLNSTPADYIGPDYAMVDQGVLTLSRLPKDYEVGGIIVADTIAWIPQLTLTDSTLLTTITPPKLVVLGVSKDQLPPDLVRGGLADLIETRYTKLLADAIQDNGGTSMDDESMPDDLSFIGGNYLNG